MRGKGRHDPCVLPRAAPMVEVRRRRVFETRPLPLPVAVCVSSHLAPSAFLVEYDGDVPSAPSPCRAGLPPLQQYAAVRLGSLHFFALRAAGTYIFPPLAVGEALSWRLEINVDMLSTSRHLYHQTVVQPYPPSLRCYVLCCVCQAMVALVLADSLMQQKAQCELFPAEALDTLETNPLGKKLTGAGMPGAASS